MVVGRRFSFIGVAAVLVLLYTYWTINTSKVSMDCVYLSQLPSSTSANPSVVPADPKATKSRPTYEECFPPKIVDQQIVRTTVYEYPKPGSPCAQYEYQLPHVPEDIVNMVPGVDIPALAPSDERDHTILYSLFWIRYRIFKFPWSNEILVRVPPTYWKLLNELMLPYYPNWNETTKGMAPPDFFELGNYTQLYCRDPCIYPTENHYPASLAHLTKMPSITIYGYLWLSSRFLWILHQHYRSPKSLWTLEMNFESVEYYPMSTYPFNQHIVNLTVGYDRKRYQLPWLPKAFIYLEDFINPPPLVPLREKNATSLIFWMQSNCDAKSHRHLIVKELQKYMPIDIYGKCMQNKEFPEWVYKYGEDMFAMKRALLENYPFVLSLENSIVDDWVTEKFWQPIGIGSIPVYLGPDTAIDFIPTENDPAYPLFINIRDWENLEDLAFYLKALASNETMYNRFHRWRQIPYKERREKAPLFKWTEEQNKIQPMRCTFCMLLHKGKENLEWPTSFMNSKPTSIHYDQQHPLITRILAANKSAAIYHPGE